MDRGEVCAWQWTFHDIVWKHKNLLIQFPWSRAFFLFLDFLLQFLWAFQTENPFSCSKYTAVIDWMISVPGLSQNEHFQRYYLIRTRIDLLIFAKWLSSFTPSLSLFDFASLFVAAASSCVLQCRSILQHGRLSVPIQLQTPPGFECSRCHCSSNWPHFFLFRDDGQRGPRAGTASHSDSTAGDCFSTAPHNCVATTCIFSAAQCRSPCHCPATQCCSPCNRPVE